jgi:hypothetical protein
LPSLINMSASAAMRSLMRAQAAMGPRATRAARQAMAPVFSVQARHMSIPRPTWDKPLPELDPEVYKIIQQEQNRQHKGIALIPSENYTTHAVSQVALCQRSCGLAPPRAGCRARVCGGTAANSAVRRAPVCPHAGARLRDDQQILGGAAFSARRV